MKVLAIVVLCLVAAIYATPYSYIPEVDYYGRGGRYGGGYGGGREYGHSGSHRGESGYLDEGYGSHGYDEGHNIQHQENEFDKSVHQHQVSDQNIGGISSGGHGGHLQSGHGGFESGVNNYGRDYEHGFNYGI